MRPVERWRPVSTLEVVLLVVATLIALVLRGWHFGSIGLTHFDEGVYAFSGMGLADASHGVRLFPDQQKFSPPVYFSLVALLNVIGFTPERSPFVVNLVIGTLTVPLLWTLVRRWFGPVAAVSAATLVAMSEFHVTMSRTALTDVTFAFTFLLACAAVLVAIERGTKGAAIVAGVLVGLSWNTKYHGWFALVIGAMVIAGRWRLQGAGMPWLRSAARQWVLMAVVAAVCYAPWSIFIQQQPGSSMGWASYFATMLRFNWLGNLWQQVQQQMYLEGPWSRASVPLAVLAAQLLAAREGRRGAPWLVPVLGVAALLIGSAGCAAVLAVMALWRFWHEGMTGPAWLLAGLVALWFVMAPVYHPYFRLIVPFTLATFALGSATIDAVLRPARAREAARPWLGLATVAAVAVIALWRPDPSDPWRPTPELERAAMILDAQLPDGAPVHVMGEPALAFYLHRRGHPSFGRTTFEGLDTLPGSHFLVTGIYLRRAPRLRERYAQRADNIEPLARVPVGLPSDLRLLDDFRPDSARRWITSPDSTYDLLLYRYTSRGAGQ